MDVEEEEEENNNHVNIQDLPDELLIAIFRYLPFPCLLSAEFVCEKWYEISRSKAIWKYLPVEYDSKNNNFAGFIDLLEGHSHLVSKLIFRNVNSYSEIRSVLNLCNNLTELRMYMCGVNNKITKDVQNYPDLKCLSIKNCYSQWGKIEPLTSEIDFHKLPQLRELILTDFGLNNNNMEGLVSCNNLNCLYIDKIKTISQDNMMKFMEIHKENLKVLAIYGLNYDDQIVESAMNCPKLTHLSITRCERLTNVSIRILQEKSRLKQLSLWNNKLFSKTALEDFLVCGNFTRLNYVSFSKIKWLDARHLAIIAIRCPVLNFIGIYQCPLLNSKLLSDEIERLFWKSKVIFE